MNFIHHYRAETTLKVLYETNMKILFKQGKDISKLINFVLYYLNILLNSYITLRTLMKNPQYANFQI